RGRAITESMGARIDRVSFEIVFSGVGAFPPRGAPRVLWLGVTEGAEATTALQRQVTDRLEPLGVQPERRPYSPHLTLARWRESRPGDARQILSEPVGVVARVPVTAVTL